MTADVYSFGCLAFEALTGKLLFDGSHEMALVTAHVTHDGRPDGVLRMANDPRMARTAALLSHCLRREPKDRPDIATLRRALKGLAPQIAPMPWPWVLA
jgi:serine/threonine protein kinase